MNKNRYLEYLSESRRVYDIGVMIRQPRDYIKSIILSILLIVQYPRHPQTFFPVIFSQGGTGCFPNMRCYISATLQQAAARHFSHCRSNARESLPSIAPKPSIDIKHIRQYPETHAKNCSERNYKAQVDHPWKIVRLLEQRRQSQTDALNLRKQSNAIQSELSSAKGSSETEGGEYNGPEHELQISRGNVLEEARNLKHQLSTIEAHEAQLTLQIDSLAAALPNFTSPDTPRHEHRVVGYINESLKPSTESVHEEDRTIRDHVRIGAELDLLDFSAPAKTSGWGWYYLKNEAALLEQALVQYALSVAMKHNFTVVTPPSMVYSHIASASGFRPRDQNDEQQIYAIQQNDRDEERDKPSHSLAATAEIPFAGMEANEVIKHDELPIMVVGPSRCYRAEAGARGANTKGLYRVHEFTKVEMFAWTAAGAESALFETMIKVQTEILQGLGLHCRILEMPSSDLGASAFRKRDIEAYFPSRRKQDEGWGEVTSTSICTDYQTRRLNTRVKNPAGSDSKLGWPSTVNGTAVAVPRVLAALLEYHCEERDGDIFVKVPEVLRPWMHGIGVIGKEKPRREIP